MKQHAKRWLSGLLAVVMMVGLIPATSVISASAAEPPDSITCSDHYFFFSDKFVPKNPITGEKLMPIPGHESVLPRYFEFTGSDGTVGPGLCADHTLDWPSATVGKGTGYKWGDPVNILDDPKMKKVAPIVANFYVNYFQAMYLVDQAPSFENLDEAGRTQWIQENVAPLFSQDLNWGANSYWGQPGTHDFLGAYAGEAMAAQAAVWLAAGGLLSPGDELTEADLEQIYGVAAVLQYECYGKELAAAGHPDWQHANDWYNGAVAAKKGWGQLAIERYKNTKDQFDGITPSMEIYVYYPPNNKYQPIVWPALGDVLGAEAWIGVKKVDESGKGLAGAVFGVWESEAAAKAGQPPKATLTTDSTGEAREKISWGSSTDSRTFFVKEITPPSGYKQDSSIVPVQVSKTTNATKETAAMARGPGGWVNKEDNDDEFSVINKVDASGHGIGKAKFNLKCVENGYDEDIWTDESGHVAIQWTNPEKPNYVKPGEYTVSEIDPPPGYEIDKDPTKSSQPLRLWVEEVNGVKVGMHSGPITFVNYEKHTIIIEKVGPNGGLAGAVFNVYFNGAKIDTVTTGDDGKFTYNGVDGKGLQTGVYSFEEITPPPGYLLPATNKREQSVAIDTENDSVKIHTLVFENYQYPEIKIHKTSNGTDIGLAGATFEIKVNGQKVAGEFQTGSGGWISIPWSIYGKYIGDGESNDSFTVEVRETVAPAGYLIDDDGWHSITFSKGQTAGTFEFEDTGYPDIIILKVDADDPTKVLPGATFEVKIEGQETFSVGPTGDDGKIVIPYEKYGEFLKDETRDQWEISIREVSPPKGYLISDKSWHEQTLKRGEKKIEFVFKDAEYPKILIAKKDKEYKVPVTRIKNKRPYCFRL